MAGARPSPTATVHIACEAASSFSKKLRDQGCGNDLRQQIDRHVIMSGTAIREHGTVAGENADDWRNFGFPNCERIGKNDGVIDHHAGEGRRHAEDAGGGKSECNPVLIEFQALEWPARASWSRRRGFGFFAGLECLVRDRLKWTRQRPWGC